jgi:Fe-Mn family superoxide dismutase
MDRFQQLLTEAAESIIGSGWVWLAAEGDRGVHISTTENNDVVPLASVSPLLILDMWEHAYLPMNHFDKAAYVEDWFSLIDWGKANERYLAALSGAAVG